VARHVIGRGGDDNEFEVARPRVFDSVHHAGRNEYDRTGLTDVGLAVEGDPRRSLEDVINILGALVAVCLGVAAGLVDRDSEIEVAGPGVFRSD